MFKVELNGSGYIVISINNSRHLSEACQPALLVLLYVVYKSAVYQRDPKLLMILR